jgi:hypothetical protein
MVFRPAARSMSRSRHCSVIGWGVGGRSADPVPTNLAEKRDHDGKQAARRAQSPVQGTRGSVDLWRTVTTGDQSHTVRGVPVC